ncbi:MAG: AraC family transcriptional regulator [Bacteroidota bacterium]
MIELKSYGAALKKLLLKFQQLKIGYKNGAYQMNCLVNSPFTIIESLAAMPFSVIDREKQVVSISTIFANSGIYYNNPEEGLWILNYHNFYKKNLMITNIFDETIPMQYSYVHFLSKDGSLNDKAMIANGVSINNNMWSMAKIGQPRDSMHYKNTTEISTAVFFTEEWLQKNKLMKNTIKLFFDSKGKHLVLHNNNNSSDNFYNQFLQLLKKEKSKQKTIEIIENIKHFLQIFSTTLDENKLTSNHFLLADNDWKRILLAEQFLKENLFKDFPGIDAIAEKVSISPSKLKNDFKLVHQKTIYAYFQEQQMKIAHQLIAEQGYLIKDVASLLCYENSSKFTDVFKKHYGYLPSSLFNKE